MAKIDIQAFEATSTGSGFRIAYVTTAAGQFIRLSISKAAQLRSFGTLLDPEKHRLLLSLDDAPELRKFAELTLVEPRQARAIALHGAGFESVVLKLVPWVRPEAQKIKPQEMRVESLEHGKLVKLSLPLWAQPGRPKASAAPKKIGEGQSIMDDLPMRK